MKARVLTTLLILVIVLPPILLGGWLLEILGLFVIVMASYEWLKNLEGYNTWKWFVLPFMILVSFMQGFFPEARVAIISAGLLVVWALPIFAESFTETDAFMSLSFLLIVTCAFDGIQALMPAHLYLLTICLANYGSDTGAFFAGRFFGKHKLAPKISPKKTWEGFFGGWAFGFVLSMLVSLLYINQLNPMVNLAICVFSPVGAAIGDLCFSGYKRYLKIKDFSSFLPGHGGLLDRLDSLIFNLIAFNILLQLFG